VGETMKRAIAAIFLAAFGLYGLSHGQVLGIIPILIAISLSLGPNT
jgi:hypothetical protein